MKTGLTPSTASFSFSAPTGATVVQLVYSTDSGVNWLNAQTEISLSSSSVSAKAIHLTADTSYQFKLIVTGGSFAGISNIVTVQTDVAASTPSILINEGFDGGGTAPAGWSFNSMTLGTYSGNLTDYGSKKPSIKLSGSANEFIQTPVLSTSATELSFWLKGQSTDTSSSLLIQGLQNGTWIDIATIKPLSTVGKVVTYKVADGTLPTGITQMKFTYKKVLGNLAIDDVLIKG
ncbi:hypothetical protein D3C73_1028110 [compost metagenome]